MKPLRIVAPLLVLFGAASLLASGSNAQTVTARPAVGAAPIPAPAPAAVAGRVPVTAIREITPKMKRPTGIVKADTGLELVRMLDERPIVAAVPRRIKSIVNSCEQNHLKLAWPLQGTPGQTYVINNYTDLDASSGKRDFKNAVGDLAINYNGHRGYDIDVGTFRDMDQNRVHARAAAPGVVIETRADQPDRNTSCTGNWNYVAVRHLNGFVTYYGHLKKNSVSVAVGANVTEGQALGVVGSSGCSSHAHLHFEVHDCDNKWLEPASVQGMWKVNVPSLEQSGLLDLVLRNGALTHAQVLDPAPNVTTIGRNQTLGIGLSVALRPGDELSIVAFGPGIQVRSTTVSATGRYGHGFWRWSVPTGGATGTMQIGIWINDELVRQQNVTVN